MLYVLRFPAPVEVQVAVGVGEGDGVFEGVARHLVVAGAERAVLGEAVLRRHAHRGRGAVDTPQRLRRLRGQVALRAAVLDQCLPDLIAMARPDLHCGQVLKKKRERNVLFNDTLNTFYLRLYGVRHMVKDHSDSEKGNPLPPHRLLFSINSKGSFICTITQTGYHIPRPLLHQLWSTGWRETHTYINMCVYKLMYLLNHYI